VFEGDGVVRDFPGNYSQFRIDQLTKEKETAAKPVIPAVTEKNVSPSAVKRKLSFKEQRALEQLEKEMPALEKERHELSEAMNSGKMPYEQLEIAANRIKEIGELLDEKEMQWLELSEN
jgi:ATP-binding cassette subfamily F protein uup